ncbi:MAG: hypothetical protein CVV49_13870 [Spirochaetae bacterium HGW-Spirochaetae-5]|nr:MAG: hypothetical protein CVV49_13870 [Spirochaetae bacterium HGW-Spirochaetae-5]
MISKLNDIYSHSFFKMSVINAVINIRRFAIEFPSVEQELIVSSIKKINSDYASLDYCLGEKLNIFLPKDILFDNYKDDIRSTLFFLLIQINPWWLKAVPFGRRRILSLINDDELQCLSSADLFDDPPSEEIVVWWDKLSEYARSFSNNSLLIQGRKAEKLSLAYEHLRLKSLGISIAPQWVAIEDNTLGYDIISYNKGISQPINQFIEVKSSSQFPLKIIISRNEWNVALKYADLYLFHIWDIHTSNLQIKTVDEMKNHIPNNIGNGCWQSVEIII